MATGKILEGRGEAHWLASNGAALVISAEGFLEPLGYEQLTGFTSAKTLAEAGATIPPGATIAYIQAEAQNFRYTENGPAPTATTGMRLLVGESMLVANLDTLEFFQEAATGKLNVTYK